ncbi:hypothetical protein ACFV4K_02735 [Nocardia sp. NPDC059764]|uniref:hypothetical protein n=1 Tax=Nocardia sp. NPDC059764 TaxID=3346939 RepID=UPI0036623933
MNTTEVRVMRALASGGQLTVDQIACAAGISVRSAQTGMRSLAAKGFTVGTKGMRGNAWTLTSTGSRFAIGRRGRALLDIPEPGQRRTAARTGPAKS